MGLPLAALAGLYGLSAVVGASANLYSQYKQRELYRYRRGAYERQLADLHAWETRTGRKVRYPELGPAGKIRALDTGISQSYAGSVGTLSGLAGSIGTSAYYGGKAAGLYSSSDRGRRSTSRYL